MQRHSVLSRRLLQGLLLGSLLIGSVMGCESETQPPSYVARVGDHYLTQSTLSRLMDGMGPVPDSTEARQQVIEQWIERTLLLREAERLNLSQKENVKRLLEKRRKSTLVTALTERIYEQTDRNPTDEEVRTYFERHQNQLTLREPYVRVRHLATATEDSAQAVRRRLRTTRGALADSAWAQLTRRYARSPQRALELSDRFLPEGRLFARLPYVQDELANLREGEVSPVIEDDDQFHVLQLVRRIPAGTDPKLRWVEAEIRRRLQIRSRKQMYAREVQRLRNRAKANGLIEAP
jgi:parvulin-like peptidyl-prolyl isomerase